MSLTKILQDVWADLDRIKILHKQKKDVFEEINDTTERRDILDRYRFLMDASRKNILETVKSGLVLPPGVTLNKINASDSSSYPSNLNLSFLLDHSQSKNISFSQIYAQAYQIRSAVPQLSYDAEVSYDAQNFLDDFYFDPRSSTSVEMWKEGSTFTPEPFLTRKEFEGVKLKISYRIPSQETIPDIQIASFYPKEVWNPVLKEVARKFKGICDISFCDSDYAEMLQEKSFFGRIKANLQVHSLLSKETSSREIRRITNAILKNYGVVGSSNKSSYQGSISVEQLERLEDTLGRSLTTWIRQVDIPADVHEDHRKMKETLHELVAYFAPLEVPGTNPRQFRITREQAEKFLQQDLETAYSLVKKVPLSSFYVRGIEEGSDYERRHLPLLRKLGALTTLNLERLFPEHNYYFDHAKEDEYRPKYQEIVLEELKLVNIPDKKQNEVLRKLQERKSGDDTAGKCGYLNIQELYDLQLTSLQQAKQDHFETLLQRYWELYKDVPATPLSITCKINNSSCEKKESEFPHPFIMNMNGKVKHLRINSHQDFLYFDSSEERNELNILITQDNPYLLPIQKYVLDVLGVKVANEKIESSV